MQGTTQQIKEFIAFAAKLKGDEKGESQIFVHHLFRSTPPNSPNWIDSDENHAGCYN
jgi:hypothetical protein